MAPEPWANALAATTGSVPTESAGELLHPGASLGAACAQGGHTAT